MQATFCFRLRAKLLYDDSTASKQHTASKQPMMDAPALALSSEGGLLPVRIEKPS